jgi:chromosome segregation ATPase
MEFVQVNQHLSSVYRKLTKYGDAYLSYTEDKSVLFVDGVAFLGKKQSEDTSNAKDSGLKYQCFD